MILIQKYFGLCGCFFSCCGKRRGKRTEALVLCSSVNYYYLHLPIFTTKYILLFLFLLLIVVVDVVVLYLKPKIFVSTEKNTLIIIIMIMT